MLICCSRQRRKSEDGGKPVAVDTTPLKKKAAWRQLDLNALDKEPVSTAVNSLQQEVTSPPANPWKQLPAATAVPLHQQQQSSGGSGQASRPLAEIMAQEVKVRTHISITTMNTVLPVLSYKYAVFRIRINYVRIRIPFRIQSQA
jgi:hypothetical protein